MSSPIIWLINPYSLPPGREQRIQTQKRAEYLKKSGFEVKLITGSHLHNTDINIISDRKLFLETNYNGINYIHIKTSNHKNNYFKRSIDLLLFYIKIFYIAKKFKKPDYISLYAAIPFSNIIYFFAKKNKIELILDVVDLWPESIVSLKLISKYNPLLWCCYEAEKWMYKRASKIVFSMEGGKDYLIDKGWANSSKSSINLDKVFYINNGVDLAEFNFCKKEYKINDIDLENSNTFKIMYIGSIRIANGVNSILSVAQELSNYKDIQFFIYGTGPERYKIEKRIHDENILNVKLKQEWLDIKYIPYILSKSSLNLLHYAQSDIWKYGGSQSKLFQYMASAKPIISNIDMSYCPIKNYNLGISKQFENSVEYAQAILDIYKMNDINYKELCQNSYNISKLYNYKYLTDTYIKYCIT